MKRKKLKPVMSFRDAVELTPDIRDGYKNGLVAFGAYSTRVIVAETSELQGSVDIDACTKSKYPQDNRWDYAFAYKGEVLFVEVHSAISSEVKIVLKKLQWLKDWLVGRAPEINKLKASNNPFVWVQSKNFEIPKNTPQYRMALEGKLLPVRNLKLN